MKIDEILDATADLYVTGKYRWIQGRADDFDGGLCMSHAMWFAAGKPHFGQRDHEVFVDARRYLEDSMSAYSTRGTSIGVIPEWNDDPDRTEEQVVDKLRSLARDYREAVQS